MKQFKKGEYWLFQDSRFTAPYILQIKDIRKDQVLTSNGRWRTVAEMNKITLQRVGGQNLWISTVDRRFRV